MRVLWWLYDVGQEIVYWLERFFDRGIYILGAICGLIAAPVFLWAAPRQFDNPLIDPNRRVGAAIMVALLGLMMLVAAALFVWAYIDHGRRSYDQAVRHRKRHRSALDAI